MGKYINRDGQEATKIFDNRSLKNDYSTLLPVLKKGMRILDVGCGTGSITRDIAEYIGKEGSVTGIDNTLGFIESGKKNYGDVKNLELLHVDLFTYDPEKKFDLIVSARVLQWLDNPIDALKKMKQLLNPGGIVSILDYNHEEIEWNPSPPESMQIFYNTFLKWRSDSGMNNRIAEDLSVYLEKAGFGNISIITANENYTRENEKFKSKVGVWSQVAGSSQMVQEGYLEDDLRLKAISEYDKWIDDEAISMTMKLNEVRGVNII